MQRKSEVLALMLCLALGSERAGAKESIEFVAEHLAEIAMDNRYASLPLWNECDEARRADRSACYGINGGYARTHSGTLSFDGPLLAFGAKLPIGKTLQLTGLLFFDDFSLGSGVERRPLDVLFADVPLTLPAEAEFTGLDGKARDVGLGVAINGRADWSWLPWFEWSAGVMWQQFKLRDYRFDYLVLEGPDAGARGTLDYSATYTHTSPFAGAAWPRAHYPWHYAPHVQIAMPLPRRGIAGRITGPGFDLTGNTADHGAAPFGDPSLTIGFNVTYLPWNLSVDLGSTITQALIEPKIHEGVQHDLMLSVGWTF
jgi:outer membrane receptor protein involved in Fe transport